MRLGPMSERTWGRPALSGDSGLCPSARGVHQQSRVTCARVAQPTRSTRYLWRLVPCSEGPWGLPAITGSTGLGPRARGVDQMSRETWASVRCPRYRHPSWETRDLVGGSAWSTRLSGDSGPCPRAHGFDQHPGRLWTVLGVAVLNSCPRELVLVLRAPGVDQRSGRHRSGSEAPRFRTAVPGDLRSGSRAREFDPMSLATRAWFRCPAGSTRFQRQLGPKPSPRGSTRCPARLWPSSEGLRGGPAVPGHSRLRPTARGVDQLPQAPGAQVRKPSGSTSSPGRLGSGSTRCCVGPAVPGHSRLYHSAIRVDQRS